MPEGFSFRVLFLAEKPALSAARKIGFTLIVFKLIYYNRKKIL